MSRITFLLAASLSLAGCAGTTPMVLGPDHPANPNAAVAPVPPPSTTLAVSTDATTMPSPAPTDSGGGGDMAHMHHGGGGVSGQPAPRPTTSQSNEQAVYTCPMHPEVISDRAGQGPKCGMKLVKKEGGR